MDNLYKNKYRTHTVRLENYDYSQDGYYFVTICTDKKKLYFGRIDNGKTRLNKLGVIVEEELLKTSEIRKNVVIDKYVVMPNHLHVVIVINNKFIERPQVIEPDSNSALQGKQFFSVEMPRWGISGTKDNKTPQQRDLIETPQRGASTDTKYIKTPQRDLIKTPQRGASTDMKYDKTPQRGASTERNIHRRKEWQAGSLGVIINQFKSVCTKRLHKLGYTNFKWQAGYYDHIIRNEQDYNNIWDYIDYNPDKWMWDKDNPERIKK